jgi:ADP-heptose:LPS heptosyltransferase
MRKSPRLRNVRKVAIISWGFWGDSIIMTPLLDALHDLYPGVRIILIIGPSGDRGRRAHPGFLFQNDPRVSGVYVTGSLAAAALMLGRRCDLAIDLVSSRQTRIFVKASGALNIISAKFCQKTPRIFSWLTLGDDGRRCVRRIPMRRHLGILPDSRSQQLLKIARFLNNREGRFRSLRPKLFVSNPEQRWANGFLLQKGVAPGDTIIGIQPGGHWPHRLWPAGYYGLVARSLSRRNKTRVLVFFAPGETRYAQRVRRASQVEVVLIGERNARRYMALLSQCQVFISSDGGPLHLALACGVPCVGLFKDERNAALWFDWRARKDIRSVFFPKQSPREQVAAVLAGVKAGLRRKR